MPCFGSPALRFAPLSGGVWVRAWRHVLARPSSCFPTLSPRTPPLLCLVLVFWPCSCRTPLERSCRVRHRTCPVPHPSTVSWRHHLPDTVPSPSPPPSLLLWGCLSAKRRPERGEENHPRGLNPNVRFTECVYWLRLQLSFFLFFY